MGSPCLPSILSYSCNGTLHSLTALRLLGKYNPHAIIASISYAAPASKPCQTYPVTTRDQQYTKRWYIHSGHFTRQGQGGKFQAMSRCGEACGVPKEIQGQARQACHWDGNQTQTSVQGSTSRQKTQANNPSTSGTALSGAPQLILKR